MARAEIAELRDERDRLRAAVRRQLGEQLDQIGHRSLVERIDELTGQLRAREQSEAAARADADRLCARVRDLEDDLAAARTSLRNVLKDVNRPGAATGPLDASQPVSVTSADAGPAVLTLVSEPRGQGASGPFGDPS
jgi:DnaJ-domain-containing protein 1